MNQPLALPQHAAVARPSVRRRPSQGSGVLRGIAHGLIVTIALASLYGISLVASTLGYYATADMLLTPRMSFVVAGGVLITSLLASALRRR